MNGDRRCSNEILPNSLSTPTPLPPSSKSFCGNFFALIHQFLNTAVLTMAMDILTMTMVFYRRWTNFFAKIISPQNRCKKWPTAEVLIHWKPFFVTPKDHGVICGKNTQGGRIFRFDWKEVTGRQEYISNQNRIYSYSNSFKYLLTVL